MQDDNSNSPEPPETEASAQTPNQLDGTDVAAAPANEKTAESQVIVGGRKSHKGQWTILILLVLLLLVGGAYWLGTRHNSVTPTSTKTNQTPATKSTTAQGLQLDESKDYGNKYSNGLLPVGDGKYSATSAKQGYVYACSGYAKNLASDNGGASVRGPWFTNNNTEYDVNKKSHVQGSVAWQAEFTNTVSGSTRTITTNDLPSHPTGIFPIMSTDPAYQYDRNPNKISSQSLSYALPANPTYNQTPQCMGGQSGIMLTGVALFNGFDAGGRDAGAWEVQDNCSGHPEKEGEYHYHTLSSCIKDTSVHTIIGYALDGFPITGPKLAENNILTTSDLDACHGITSKYTVDGKTVTGYHYVMTQDFPYSVSCFRGNAINPPGLPSQAPQP